MRIRIKVMALAVVTGLVVALVPVAAQTSNTAQATYGNFKTDVDNFLSVHDYTKVDMEKWFGYAGYDSSMLSLGYARNIGDLYLGTYYNGNMFYSSNPTDITEVETTNYVTTGVIIGNEVVTSDWNYNPKLFTNNRFDVLIGVAGMGIRVGFYEDLETATGRFTADNSFNFNDTADVITVDSTTNTRSVVEYTDGVKTSGSIRPSIQWGMSLPMDAMTLKPFAYVELNLYQDSAASTMKDYTEVWGTKESGAMETTAGMDNGNIKPTVYLGAAVDFAKKDTTQSSAQLVYGFSTGIYSNSNNSVAGTAEWIKTSTDTYDVIFEQNVSNENVSTVEKSDMNHILFSRYSFTKDLSDRISVGMIANAEISVSSNLEKSNNKVTNVKSYNKYTQNPADDYVETTVTTTPGDTVETSSFGFSPYLQGGLAFDLVPGVFVLNAGINVDLPAYTNETIKTTRSDFYESKTTTVDGTGVVTSDTVINGSSVDLTDPRVESQSSRNDWNAMSASISAGFTLNLDKNMAFDALMSTSNFSVDATNFSLIFTVKQ